MRICLFVIFLIVGVQVIAQPPAQRDKTIEIISERHGFYEIPDPDDRLRLASLLRNASVAKALSLTARELEFLDAAFKKSGGSLGTGAFLIDPINPQVAYDAEKDAIRANNEMLDELLPPAKWKRLRELAFQVEIGRIGLGPALTEGRLSKEVGVYENQKENLISKAEAIEEKTSAAIAKLLQDAQTELLKELTPEQRDIAVSAIGKPFFFRDEFRPKMGADPTRRVPRPNE